jgi:starch synthase
VSELRHRYPDAIGARIGFDAQEARALFAGADFLLMPSRFEPCGLSQMFAQRFGALPIAHRTGGLAETVDHRGAGLLFDGATTASLTAAIDDAFEIYAAPREFQAMRRAAMAKNFTWENSATKYAALYRRLTLAGA